MSKKKKKKFEISDETIKIKKSIIFFQKIITRLIKEGTLKKSDFKAK